MEVVYQVGRIQHHFCSLIGNISFYFPSINLVFFFVCMKEKGKGIGVLRNRYIVGIVRSVSRNRYMERVMNVYSYT